MRTLKYIYTFSLALVVLFGCTEDEDLSFVDNIVAPSEVTANFSITQDNSGVVTITPNAVGATNYNINYGDGSEEIVNVVQGESTTHTYVEGSYTVTIEAIGLTGLKTEVTENLTVSFEAPKNLEISAIINPSNPFQVDVSATAELAAAFEVYFDTSNTAEEPTPLGIDETVSFEYPLVGDYTIKVVALSGGIATTEKEKVITISAPTELPIDFELFDTTVLFGFGGASADVVENPDTNGNSSQKVARTIKGGPEIWAGNVIVASSPIDFSVKKLIKLDVWSPRPGGKLLFKIENLDNPGIFIEKEITLNGNSSWEEAVIDFSDIDTSQSYQKLVWFYDFGSVGDGSADWTFYLDNIRQDFAGVSISQGIEDFEGPAPTFTDFGDIAPTVVIANPDVSGINTSANVAQFTKSVGAQFWGGTFFDLSEPLDLDTFKSIIVKTWSPRVDVNVRLKIENSNDPNQFAEVDALTTVASAWEELVFDFSGAGPYNFDRIVIFFDFDVNNSGDGSVYYFDEFELETTVVDFSVQDFEGPAPAFTDFGDIAPTVVIANPDVSGINTSANVAQFTKSVGAQFWGGTFFDLSEPLDLDTFKNISVKTWSPRVDVNVRLKIENSNDPNQFAEVDALTTVANSWEELVFDFSGAGPYNYDRIVIFFDFDVNNSGDGSIYYFDEFKLTN
jgi:hypothetical protein